MLIKSIKKYVLIVLGSLSLTLGIVGIFIPVLPTTPFLLLASFCYIRSSKHLYNWLINHKVIGEYIFNYMTYRAVKLSTKIGALLFLWISLIVSMIFVSNLHLRLFLFAVGVGVSIHLYSLKTLNN